MDIEPIKLQHLRWPKGASARMWFCQPRVELTAPAPFRPTTNVSLDLLRAVLDLDALMGAPAGGAPSIVLLPELSIGHNDVVAVRGALSAARPNTLLISGIGHMTATDIDPIEASVHLCGQPLAGHYANCAIIGCGGTDQIFLQPKVVASREELDCHWPGRIIRYFVGEFFSFVVLICSEMLDRAQARTTIREVVDKLAEESRQLAAVFWLQHNPKPRSVDFSQSLEELTHIERPSVFVVGSRNQCPPRFENFAVSGAFFKKAALPRYFNVLTRQFHYVEPVSDSTALSRVVLLRYDVDVNLVETALASAIEDSDRTPRSQLFSSVFPMVMQNGSLVDSVENTHLAEIVSRARDIAIATDNTQMARIQQLTDALVALGTPRFQDFLDRAIVPRPRDEKHRHAAGQQHDDGDYFCDCWKHRQCIDVVCDDNSAAEPIAYLLLALARIAAQGLNVSLIPVSDSPANIRLSCPISEFDLCIVYPFNFDADATEIAIRGGARPKAAEPGYIVLGTAGRAGRPPLAQISQAVARFVAPLRAATATEPLLRAVYNDELATSSAAGNLVQLFQQRFG
jgi:hypothetical protein